MWLHFRLLETINWIRGESAFFFLTWFMVKKGNQKSNQYRLLALKMTMQKKWCPARYGFHFPYCCTYKTEQIIIHTAKKYSNCLGLEVHTKCTLISYLFIIANFYHFSWCSYLSRTQKCSLIIDCPRGYSNWNHIIGGLWTYLAFTSQQFMWIQLYITIR